MTSCDKSRGRVNGAAVSCDRRYASALTRAAVVNSLRFTLTEFASGAPIPAVLLAALRQFLATLEDADLKVRRGALLALNCVAHNKPAAVRDALPELLPMLYEQVSPSPNPNPNPNPNLYP